MLSISFSQCAVNRLVNLDPSDKQARIAITIEKYIHAAYQARQGDHIPITSALRHLSHREQAAILRHAEVVLLARQEEARRQEAARRQAILDAEAWGRAPFPEGYRW